MDLNRKEELLFTAQQGGVIITYRQAKRLGFWYAARSMRQVLLISVGMVSVGEQCSCHKYLREKAMVNIFVHTVNTQRRISHQIRLFHP